MKNVPAPPGSWLRRLVESLTGEPRDLEQLTDVLEDARDRGLIDADVLAMLEGVLQVSEIQVRDVMVPRSQMVVVQPRRPAREDPARRDRVRPLALPGGGRGPRRGRRHPARQGPAALLRAEERAQFDIRECLRPAVFIPESKRLNVLLKEFRVSHNHMAIVVDEYGGVSGLLTIEDVLEQIVGDIGDEYDVDEGEGIRKRGRAHVHACRR